MIGRFATSTAYRQALEARLLAAYGSERVQSGRKRLVTERLVVRLQDQRPSGFLVKGGFALELRLAGESRTTRDLDVDAATEVGSGADAVAGEVEAACRIGARDGFEMLSARAPEEIAATQKARTFRFMPGSSASALYTTFYARGEAPAGARLIAVVDAQDKATGVR